MNGKSLSPGALPGKPQLSALGWAWEQLVGGSIWGHSLETPRLNSGPDPRDIQRGLSLPAHLHPSLHRGAGLHSRCQTVMLQIPPSSLSRPVTSPICASISSYVNGLIINSCHKDVERIK